MVELLMEPTDADAVWDQLTAHLKNGKSIRSLGDTIQLGAAELILRTTVPRQFTDGQHPFDYCNTANYWMRTQRQSLSAAHSVSDGQLRQRRGAREQALQFGDRAGMRRVRCVGPHAGSAAAANTTTRSWHSTSRARPRSPTPICNRAPTAAPIRKPSRSAPAVPGRSAQPEDHGLDLRGIRSELDAFARPFAARHAAAARRLAEDAGRTRVLCPLREGVDQQLIGREERRLLEGGDASSIAAMHGSGSVKDRASGVIHCGGRAAAGVATCA